jgi:hypothetical protein
MDKYWLMSLWQSTPHGGALVSMSVCLSAVGGTLYLCLSVCCRWHILTWGSMASQLPHPDLQLPPTTEQQTRQMLPWRFCGDHDASLVTMALMWLSPAAANNGAAADGQSDGLPRFRKAGYRRRHADRQAAHFYARCGRVDALPAWGLDSGPKN